MQHTAATALLVHTTPGSLAHMRTLTRFEHIHTQLIGDVGIQFDFLDPKDSLSPLTAACLCGFVDCVQQVLEGGAHADYKGPDSKLPSALDLVCSAGDAEIGVADKDGVNKVESTSVTKRKIVQVRGDGDDGGDGDGDDHGDGGDDDDGGDGGGDGGGDSA